MVCGVVVGAVYIADQEGDADLDAGNPAIIFPEPRGSSVRRYHHQVRWKRVEVLRHDDHRGECGESSDYASCKTQESLPHDRAVLVWLADDRDAPKDRLNIDALRGEADH